MPPFLILRKMLEARSGPALAWFKEASTEVADGVADGRFATLISMASRHARDSTPLAPTETELRSAASAVEGWNPERWTMLEALRVALVLSRTDLEEESAVLAVEEVFAYADEGEQRALYRSLALLPEPERFVWRAGEGCRTNMTSVLEAALLDTPFPARWFDDVAWNQAVIKCVFVGAPLWRLWGLDTRLSEELARMALDLVDERRSAHREVQPDLWLALGPHGGARALSSLEAELDPANANVRGRRAAAYALARAGHVARLGALLESERDPAVRASIQDALDGNTAAVVFSGLDLLEA
jgi:hypothetical protein